MRDWSRARRQKWMHSRRMKRWQDDQRCISEIMTDVRKIKIFFTFEKWPRNEELLKTMCIMFARGKRWTLLSYLLLFPVLLSTFCSSQEYSDPDEKTRLISRNRSFFSSSWQTREFRVYGPSEKGAQCTLCIVNVSKICTVVNYIKTDASLP